MMPFCLDTDIPVFGPPGNPPAFAGMQGQRTAENFRKNLMFFRKAVGLRDLIWRKGAADCCKANL